MCPETPPEVTPQPPAREVMSTSDVGRALRRIAHEIVETTFRKALDEQISMAIGEAATYFDAEVPPPVLPADEESEPAQTDYETTDVGTLNPETGR